MPEPRPPCAHCGHRVSHSSHATVKNDGTRWHYCTHKAACRRARHERHGRPLRIAGASDEALGAALIAADYVTWPSWTRLAGRRGRDALRSEFARRLAAAVESRAERRTGGGS